MIPNFPHTSWRLLISPPSPGAWNMAVDEAILQGMIQPETPPTLRLYAWEPGCLSLGYAQSIQDVDIPSLISHGWDIVRRPTGGRAILHIDELTYAVIGPPSEPRLAGGVLESYHCLSQALLSALHRMNIPAQSQIDPTQPNTTIKGPVCFEVPSNYEITVNGKKLIGSAQARRKEGVLQHGSLPLLGDLTRILQVLRFPEGNQTSRIEAAMRLLARATTVEEALGKTMSWETTAQALVDAFEQELNLSLKQGGLTITEEALARTLMHEKYQQASWTERG
jgi:lipoate-protein ligase A